MPLLDGRQALGNVAGLAVDVDDVPVAFLTDEGEGIALPGGDDLRSAAIGAGADVGAGVGDDDVFLRSSLLGSNAGSLGVCVGICRFSGYSRRYRGPSGSSADKMTG